MESFLLDQIPEEIKNTWLFYSVILFVGLVGYFIREFGQLLATATLKHFKRALGSWSRLRLAIDAIDVDGPGLWISRKPRRPNNYASNIKNSIPIILVANLKGGVGKTTIAANLIAHYTQKKNQRILAIDLDFQGSLSSMIIPGDSFDELLAQQANGEDSKAAQLIEGKTARWLASVAERVGSHLKGAKCIPSYYSLAAAENRVMIKWLIAERTDDVRYSLASVLHDRKTQLAYDKIILDAPPRLTTATIQGLCAATHVLIPTRLDSLSSDAVGTFIDQLCIGQEIWPELKLLGIVGNATAESPQKDHNGQFIDRLYRLEAEVTRSLQDIVEAALERGKAPLRQTRHDFVFAPTSFIPNKREISRAAGKRIVYSSIQESESAHVVRDEIIPAFDRLGDEIDSRLEQK